jgi:hypothetical protein
MPGGDQARYFQMKLGESKMKSYKFANFREASMFWRDWVEPTIRILSGDTYEVVARPNGGREYAQRYAGRSWFIQQHNRHQLHPAVVKMLELYKPADWQRVILEWPHKALTDPNRLAYTRDEKSAMYEGDSDKKALVTSIGKYLTRHWPDVPSDLIRDMVAQFTYGGTISITDEMDSMIAAVNGGPRSCMSNSFNIECDDRVDRHPYAVYDPSLGWSMAIRAEGDAVLGRCLIWTDPDDEDTKGYVRSYKREREERSASGADEAIESYLNGQGYTKWRAWRHGTPLMKYTLKRGGYLMPYIDGQTQRVDDAGDGFEINDNGDYDASCTSGAINSHDHTCEDCGAGFNDGDGYWTGIHEDHHVCQDCRDDNYTYAYSRRGNEYYIHSDDVINVDGEYYHVDWLSDNNIVELANGDYEHQDNAVYIESEDAYYHVDDDDICHTEDSHEYELKENCWMCEESGNWYTEDTDYVEVDGCTYHPDHAPEPDDEEDETASTTDTTPTF